MKSWAGTGSQYYEGEHLGNFLLKSRLHRLVHLEKCRKVTCRLIDLSRIY